MLLGGYVLLMRCYDWRKCTTLLDSRVLNNHDVGTMPMPITLALPVRRVHMPAEDRNRILFSIYTSQSSLGSDRLLFYLPVELSRRSRDA